MTHDRLLLGTVVALACFLTNFSGTSPFEPATHEFRLDSRAYNPIDEIYAPFDTLRTDLADYIWPTNASTVITSSFADYRRTHLHEGIDISTNNQKGYPVYASRDGYVTRIFISRRGYGKMLYLRHRDGFITMYAHLQRFKDPVEAYAKKLQKEKRRYSIEVDVDSTLFPVSKGDLIAYSGNSGIGAAHLHFEVRDSSFNPINPFLLPQIAAAVSDTIPPVFHSIAFTPVGKNTRIQGRHAVWVGDVKKQSSESYGVSQQVKLHGIVGISVKVTDQEDVLKYQTGSFRYEMYIDGRLLFASAKKFILENEDHQVAAYYDKGLLRSRRGRFEKLYIESGNRLSFYNRLPEGAGFIDSTDLSDGNHELKIITYDTSGNKSILTGIISVSGTSAH